MPITIDNASKRNGNNWVFRGVSFRVEDGEVFAVFGPNGAGKSELLGSIDGCDRVSEPNVSLLGRLLGTRKGSVSDRLERYVAAIKTANEALVLDEPFSGQDIEGSRRLASCLRETAAGKGLAVLFSTADVSDVFLAADRAAILANGTIQQVGTPQELYDEPEDRIVATLTGTNNLIEARRLSSSKSEMPEFVTIHGEHRLFTQKAHLKTLGAINQNSFLAIRPEQISLSFGASFPEDNLLKAMITAIRFRGPSTAVSLDCGGLELEAHVVRLVGLNVGDECMVGLPPDRIRILGQ